MRKLSLILCLLATPALAGSVDVGGYFRVAARPDFQGGDGALGYWNLYGRLMNERSYGLLDLRLGVLDAEPGSGESWASAHARIEGGSIAGADSGNGRLDNLRLSQVYVRAGNVGTGNVVWQVGTIDWYMGDLGLYDFRPANIFSESVGVSGRIDTERLELVFGVGDAGFTMHPDRYNTVLTPGGTARLRLGKLELGGGGQLYLEPKVVGKASAPHATPDIDYADLVRGELAEHWVEENPGEQDLFPDPQPRSASSFKVFGYVGVGGVGPVTWNSLYVSYRRLHPGSMLTETYDGRNYDIYLTDVSDERYQLEIADELQLRVVPNKLDVTWAAYLSSHTDADNDVSPSDHERLVMSTVLRGQIYMTPVVHLLVEGSLASETSGNGNRYRNRKDSIFHNTAGTVDSQGLEFGDSDVRRTAQLKGGLVLNPLGPGIFTRPSLRLLYGVQHSSQNNAFGNNFVVTPDQNNDFDTVERHLHHLVSIETEVWL
ncbi:MAG: hypothetical protein ACI9MC_000970 [Kiritimatiellia bacterium]